MTCPVQRVPDFLARRPSRSAPSSSYRLGVRPGVPCHELYPRALTDAPERPRWNKGDFFGVQFGGRGAE